MKINKAGTKNLILLIALALAMVLIANIPVHSGREAQGAPDAIEGILDLSSMDFGEFDYLRLDGQWEMYDGRFLSVKELSAKDSREYGDVPGNWNSYIEDPRGYATYRISVKGLEDRAYAIIVGRVFSSYRLWINGKLEAKVGTISKDKEKAFKKIMSKMIFVEPEDGEIELVFQICGNNYYKSGIIDSIKLGYYDEVMKIFIFELIRDAIIVGMMAMMCVYHIIRYIFRRKNKKNLYFGILAFLVFWDTMFEGHMLFAKIFLNLDFRYEDMIQRMVLFFVLPSLASYLNHFFGKSMDKRFVFLTWGSSLLFSGLILTMESGGVGLIVKAYNALSILYMGYIAVFLARKVKEKSNCSILMVGGFIFLAYSQINDIGVDLLGWRNEYMLAYGLLGFMLAHMFAISMKYADSFSQAEKLKEELVIKNRKLIVSNSEKVKNVNERIREISETENMYRQLFEAPFEGIAIICEGMVIKANEKFCEMGGYDEEDLVGKNIMDFIDEKSRTFLLENAEYSNDGHYEIRMIRKDSSVIDIEVLSRDITYKGKSARITAVRDITAKNRIAKINRDNLKFLEAIMDTIPNPVFYKSIEGVYLGVNESYASFHGMAKSEIIGKSMYDILPEETCELCRIQEGKVVESGEKTVYELQIKDSRSSKRDMICNIDCFTDGKSKIVGIVGAMADISMLKEIEEKLKEAGEKDHLTKLYNRAKFTEILDAQIAQGAGGISVIMFDIDYFKTINDTYGHLVGDDVLIKISSMVQDMVGQRGIVARWGGEEFIILLFESGVEDAFETAQSIRAAVEAENFGTQGSVTCSFGIASSDGKNEKMSLVSRADDALYEAKNAGRNTVVAS